MLSVGRSKKKNLGYTMRSGSMPKHQVRCRHCILGTRYFLRASPGRLNTMPPAN